MWVPLQSDHGAMEQYEVSAASLAEVSTGAWGRSRCNRRIAGPIRCPSRRIDLAPDRRFSPGADQTL